MKAHTDFRKLLKTELETRMNRNPRYSLRAFAKDLQIAPALMSDILNGKRGMSRAAAEKMGSRLGLGVLEVEFFCDLVESKHARSRAAKEQARLRLETKVARGAVLKYLTLDQDQFNFVADWYHLAILELMKTPAFQSAPEWIASRLGISVLQVRAALERLETLGAIKKNKGKWLATSNIVRTPDGIASQALKQHHEQFLKKANAALFTQHVDERDFRGLTIRCQKSDVPRVREKLRNLIQELDVELSENQNGDEVYQLSTQFFCLTQTEKEEGSRK